MSAHTPGPWDDASKYPDVASVRIFAGTHYIATVGNSDDPREVAEANARLIAAAPELLAALIACLPFIDDADDVQKFFPDSAMSGACRAAVAQAHAAIAKAQPIAPQKADV